MLSHELGSMGSYGKNEAYYGEQVHHHEIDGDPDQWIFDRVVPAGGMVIACFHHVEHTGEEIKVTLRREEAVKFAKAILG